MGKSQNKKNRQSSIPTENQKRDQIGENPSLGHFLDLSGEGKSPMIIKKGDTTPPRAPITNRDLLFAYLNKHKIPFDEKQILKEVITDPDVSIMYANGRFVFDRNPNPTSTEKAERPGVADKADTGAIINKKTNPVSPGTAESGHVNVTDNSVSGTDGQNPGRSKVEPPTDPSVSQPEFLPNHMGFTDTSGTDSSPPAPNNAPGNTDLPKSVEDSTDTASTNQEMQDELMGYCNKNGINLSNILAWLQVTENKSGNPAILYLSDSTDDDLRSVTFTVRVSSQNFQTCHCHHHPLHRLQHRKLPQLTWLHCCYHVHLLREYGLVAFFRGSWW